MVTEEGIVIKTDKYRAWVKTHKSSACEGCSSKGSCHSLGGGKEMEVEANNEIGAISGDRVQISFDSGKFIRVSFLLYIFPILMMIVGAVLGQRFHFKLNMSESAASAIGGFCFFGLAVLIVRWGSHLMTRENDYQPKITRIISRSERVDDMLRP